MQRIMRDYYKQLYANKVDNLEEMDKFIEKYKPPRMNQFMKIMLSKTEKINYED